MPKKLFEFQEGAFNHDISKESHQWSYVNPGVEWFLSLEFHSNGVLRMENLSRCFSLFVPLLITSLLQVYNYTGVCITHAVNDMNAIDFNLMCLKLARKGLTKKWHTGHNASLFPHVAYTKTMCGKNDVYTCMWKNGILIRRWREDIGFMVKWELRRTSCEWTQQRCEMLFLPWENKIHIFEALCNVLFIMYNTVYGQWN